MEAKQRKRGIHKSGEKMMLSSPKNCTVYMQKASFLFRKKPATPTKGHRWSVRFFSNSQLGRGFSIYTPPLWAKLDRTQVLSHFSHLTHSTPLYHPPARDWRSTAVQKVASHYFPFTGWVVASLFLLLLLLFLCLSLSCSSPFIRDLFFALVIVALALSKPNPKP